MRRSSRWLLFILVYVIQLAVAEATEVLWQGHGMLTLDEQVEFAVSNSPSLSGNKKWSANGDQQPRGNQQYLHFRIDVYNPSPQDETLWLIIPFPAIKHLTVTDGQQVWRTGDALPFSSRAVKSPDYVFPVHLKGQTTNRIQGVMHGEILRYSFMLTTPEHANTLYRSNISRDMVFFGAMLTLVITCLIIYAATRHLAYLSFALFAFSVGAWFFRVFGYGFEFLWPNTPDLNDISYGVLVYVVMVSAAWMIATTLRRQGKQIKLLRVLRNYTWLLVIAGLVSIPLNQLNITLTIPLYWFFGFLLLFAVIIALEHLAGSKKARWFAYAMIPMFAGAVVAVLNGMGIVMPVDVVMTMMLGIAITCLLLMVMISAYLIKLLQSQRDFEQQQAKLISRHAEELESLVKQRTQQLQESNQQLQELAAKDPLTGLPNRRSLDRFVDDCMDAEYFNIAIAMLDLDHFKRLNDTYGHDVGDKVLRQVGAILKPLCHSNRIVGRYGGEEFAIVEYQPDTDAFELTLQDVHKQIYALKIDGHPQIKVRSCIGWVVSGTNESISECFRRADKALYLAKERGRNQIVSSPE